MGMGGGGGTGWAEGIGRRRQACACNGGSALPLLALSAALLVLNAVGPSGRTRPSHLRAGGIWESPAFTPIPGRLRSRADPMLGPGMAGGVPPQRDAQPKDETITIMCAGACGTGKSNLLTAVFASPFTSTNKKFGRTRQISESTISFTADGRPITLILVDTPGFDYKQASRESAFELVQDYLENRFKRTWNLENRGRKERRDGVGVDAILYTFRPNRVDPEDLEYLQILQRYGAIVPVITKADSMTSGDLALFKQRLAHQLQSAGIETFCSPLATVAPQFQINSGEMRSAANTLKMPTTSLSNSQLPTLRTLLLNDLQRLRQVAWWRYEEFARKRLCKQYAAADRARTTLINFLRVGLVGFLALRWRARQLSSLAQEPSPPPKIKSTPSFPLFNLGAGSTSVSGAASTSGLGSQTAQPPAVPVVTTPAPTPAPKYVREPEPLPVAKAHEGDNDKSGPLAPLREEFEKNPWLLAFPVGFGVFAGPRIYNDLRWIGKSLFDDIPPS